MNTNSIDRDVLDDLVTVYLSGEASPGTSRLVEAAMQSDPELARVIDDARRRTSLPPAPPLPPGSEMATLERTRKLLSSRSSTLAVALIFTVLPLAFTFDESGLTFLMIRDEPRVGLAWWGTAAVMWIAHVLVRRKLRVPGV